MLQNFADIFIVILLKRSFHRYGYSKGTGSGKDVDQPFFLFQHSLSEKEVPDEIPDLLAQKESKPRGSHFQEKWQVLRK